MIFDYFRIQKALEEPTGWQGSVGVGNTFVFKDLFAEDGHKITLHKFIAADAEGCFHSHPATAIRWIIEGGYVEEFPDGRTKTIKPGHVGLVYPNMKHRIADLLAHESISLWIRGPKTHEIELTGPGWDK